MSMKKWIIVAGVASMVLTSCKTQEAALSAKKENKPAQQKITQEIPSDIPQSKVKNFNKLDTNKDGVLSLEEFTQTVKTSFEKKGDTSDAYKTEAEKRFTRRDTNKDGNLSLEEFATVPGKGAAPAAKKVASATSVPEEKEKNFNRLDTNKDGTLSEEEFSVSVQKSFVKKGDTSDAYKAAAKKRFAKRDINKDGKLSVEEFAGVSNDAPSLPPAKK